MYNKMMGEMGCRCPHHLAEKILGILMWIAAVLFFWSSWKMAMVWGYASGYYFEAVIVFGFLMIVTKKLCHCCGHSMMCKHGEGETCEHYK